MTSLLVRALSSLRNHGPRRFHPCFAGTATRAACRQVGKPRCKGRLTPGREGKYPKNRDFLGVNEDERQVKWCPIAPEEDKRIGDTVALEDGQSLWGRES